MKIIFALIAVALVIQANAQEYLISFAGVGAETTVNTVTVENLTKGTSILLTGDDNLRLTSLTTDIIPLSNSFSRFRIYPNPMTGSTVLCMFSPARGETSIRLFDMSGILLNEVSFHLETGFYNFKISGVRQGFYIVSICGKDYHYSEKLINRNPGSGNVNIEIDASVYGIGNILNGNGKGIKNIVDMDYTSGDRLIFTGRSGKYATIISDVPTSDKTIAFNFIECTDGDGNFYPVVKVGTQIWMAENLKTTKYCNGDLIGTTSSATLDIRNQDCPKYQWVYDGVESNANLYGRLYTWYAVTDSRKVCPSGWHLPDLDYLSGEWASLYEYLGGKALAGGKLKETSTSHWNSPNTGATNESGFTARPGGYREATGVFALVTVFSAMMSLSEFDATNIRYVDLSTYSTELGTSVMDKKIGLSVRCIHD